MSASFFEIVWRDVLDAIRSLRVSRGVAMFAVLTLALGIGANTAIFSVINALVLRPLPVTDPHRLVVVSSRSAIEGNWTPGWDRAIWEQIRQRAETAFDGTLAASAYMPRLNLAARGELDLVDGLFVSGGFFRTLGVPAQLGRTLTAADDDVGGGPEGAVAVISHVMWQRRFGGRSDVIGAPLRIHGVPFTIVGVTPRGFLGLEIGRSFDVALPIASTGWLRSDTDQPGGGPGWFLTVMLRLKPEQSVEAASAWLRSVQPDVVAAALAGEPALPEHEDYRRDPFTAVAAARGLSDVRRHYEQPLVVVFLILATVLLIACANLANLLLARAGARQKELAVRRALGASAWRLARQLLVESLMLASLGAVCGLAVARWTSQALVARLATPFATTIELDLSLDWRVLLFAATVTALTSALFGIAPVLHAARVAPIEALKRRTAAASARMSRSRLASGMLIGQVTLAVVLLVTASLLIQTFDRLARVPLGFDADRVLVVNVDAARSGTTREDRLQLFERLRSAAATIPGVNAASVSLATPFDGGPMLIAPIKIKDAPSRPPIQPSVQIVSPSWFATYGTHTRTGRVFDERDVHDAPLVAIVNEMFVRRFVADRNALGQVIVQTRDSAETPTEIEIVGVVEDSVFFGQRGGTQPTVFYPLGQWAGGPPPPEISISIRSAIESPRLLTKNLTAALTEVDGGVSFSFRLLDEHIDQWLAPERLAAVLSGVFAALVLVLVAIGLYGVTSCATVQRYSELGIRKALGAQPWDVIGLVLRQTMARFAIGLAVGLFAASLAARHLEAMLFEVAPLDPLTFVGVPLVFALTGGLAAFVPARHASRMDPLTALRRE